MELRRLLFEYRITQSELIRKAADHGYKLDHGDLSRIVNKNYRAPFKYLKGVAEALHSLGVPAKTLRAVPELNPKYEG